VSGGATVIEAAHTNALGRRGMGQKNTDFSAIPLCSRHHRTNPDSYRVLGKNGFSHGIDLKKLVLALKSRFWQDVPASRERHSDIEKPDHGLARFRRQYLGKSFFESRTRFFERPPNKQCDVRGCGGMPLAGLQKVFQGVQLAGGLSQNTHGPLRDVRRHGTV
jgi:hypothetical protein